MKEVEKIIKKRQSVRHFDPTFKVERTDISDLLEIAMQAPSSHNLQPWRFIVFMSEDAKKELRTLAYGQEQVETSAAVIAVIGNREMYEQIEQIQDQNIEAGYVKKEQRQPLIDIVRNTYMNAPEEVLQQIATFDTGLVSMQIMLLAKERGLDTVAMGGFDKQAFKQRFELAPSEFPAVLIAIGRAASPARPTTRIPIEQKTMFY